MTIMAVTGVTALVRATAYEMEKHGRTYPAQDIRDWLRMEFLNGSFIHYGLGNLFFGQDCEACRQGLIDRHVFYEGRYIGTELLPVQFVDYARSRPMTDEEANHLFQTLFQVSGWQ